MPLSESKIRLISFVTAATLLSFTVPIFLTKEQTNRTERENRITRSVLCRMAEDAYAVCKELAKETPNLAFIETTCTVLQGYSSVLPAYNPKARQAAADAAAVFSVIGENTGLFGSDETNTALIYRRCAERTAELLCEMTQALCHTDPMQSSTRDATLLFAAEALSNLAVSFSPYGTENADTPLRQQTAPAAAKQFMGESAVSRAEAAAWLRGLPGSAGVFFSHEETDGDCYRFSCVNGYAVVSVHGGHLLSYLFAPRDAHSDHACVTRLLSQEDLIEAADTFAKAVGIAQNADNASCTDRHGIRYFQTQEAEIGVRMCDGRVLAFSRYTDEEVP